jgi:hypothetical protein
MKWGDFLPGVTIVVSLDLRGGDPLRDQSAVCIAGEIADGIPRGNDVACLGRGPRMRSVGMANDDGVASGWLCEIACRRAAGGGWRVAGGERMNNKSA